MSTSASVDLPLPFINIHSSQNDQFTHFVISPLWFLYILFLLGFLKMLIATIARTLL